MADLQVVGLGMAVLDILVRLKDMPTWERGARLSAVGIQGGGPVATAMVAVSRLGTAVGFVGTCGNDMLAELKLRTLVEGGVDVSHVVRQPRPENQIVLVSVHEETGERVFSGLGGFQGSFLRAEELDREYIASAEYLHLDGYHPDAALRAARWMHEAGKKVVYDGGKTRGSVHPRVRELIEYVDVLICGSGFAPALAGVQDRWGAAEAVLEVGPSIVVQTEGEDGSYTLSAQDRFHTPAFDVNVIDTTGAGDVFHGAYIVGLLHGWDLEHIALFSTAVSAIKCTKLGGRAGIPGFDETMAFLHQHGIEMK